MTTAERIEEIFALCTCGTNTAVYFPEIAQTFWPVLDNNVTLCDLSGIFTIANPRGQDHLDLPLFTEFLSSVSKIKYPAETHHMDKLVDDLIAARSSRYHSNNTTFTAAMDKAVMRVLLQFDLPLRRAFSAFAGRGVKVGGGLTWDEVKKMEVGMDVEGFTTFAGAFALIPKITLQQCSTLARDVMNRFPLLKSTVSLSSTILYPQFQLLLCFTASVVDAAMASPPPSRGERSGRAFARGMSIPVEAKPMDVMLSNLLKQLGIAVASSTNAIVGSVASTVRAGATLHIGEDEDIFEGAVMMPSSNAPDDIYTRASKNSREVMVLRMEKIFDEVEDRLESLDDTEGESGRIDVLDEVSSEFEDSSENRFRHMSKPVVIGDSIPPPLNCPVAVQHSLEAALAHHNLGSYEESLKYLETARIQLFEGEREKILARKRAELTKKIMKEVPLDNKGEPLEPVIVPPVEVHDSEVIVPADCRFYVIACKGNVYQSCGDDEQSLLQYMKGWELASHEVHKDWEILFINSVGLLAYYNLHYELAWRCFARVSHFREVEYGHRSADTATSWNNQACCLFCMGRRSSARVLFERARNVFGECLGTRHPRTVVSSKNCDKAKRSQTILHSHSIKSNIAMRSDADRLLLGKQVTINAFPPLAPVKSSKKMKGTAKKKK